MIKKPQQLIERAKAELPCIAAADARAQTERLPATRVIDVREPQEVADSSVPGAINIPRGLLEMRIEQVVPEHDAPILVCCASGGRAALSAKTLKEMGYSDVRIIDCSHGEIAEAFQN